MSGILIRKAVGMMSEDPRKFMKSVVPAILLPVAGLLLALLILIFSIDAGRLEKFLAGAETPYAIIEAYDKWYGSMIAATMISLVIVAVCGVAAIIIGRKSAVAVVCAIGVSGFGFFACGVMYLTEDIPALREKAQEDMAQIAEGRLETAVVSFHKDEGRAGLRGIYTEGQPTMFTVYSGIGAEIGSRGSNYYILDNLGFVPDGDRLYDENKSINWNNENAGWYTVTYTANLHVVISVEPLSQRQDLSQGKEPGTETSGGEDPEEENRELRAMERGEAFTWEILQKLAEEPLPLLEDYAGYEGAVWDDMGGHALNRYLIYSLRDEKNGQDYRLMVSYMAEDNHVNMMYLQRESDISELGLYLEETGWRNTDIEEFLEHLPALSDWMAEYRLPKEEKLKADVFSANIGYGGGQTFQWIGKDIYTTEPGDSCPEEWKAAAVIFRLDGEHLVFEADGSGILKDVMLLSNHSGIVNEPVPVEGCEEQAVLFRFACDLFSAAELAEAEEAGTVIPEEETVGNFWYVCFGREGAPYGYAVCLNMRYFSEEDAVEFAKSIRFTEAAWR